ncbi:hypothetical protein, partial [Nitratifractor sp.]
ELFGMERNAPRAPFSGAERQFYGIYEHRFSFVSREIIGVYSPVGTTGWRDYPKLFISQHAICIDQKQHGRHIQSLDVFYKCAYVLAVHPYTPSIDASDALSTA